MMYVKFYDELDFRRKFLQFRFSTMRPEKPKLKCLGFTYNGAKLFNMLPLEMKKMEDPNIFKTKTKEWIWDNIPSY